MNISGKTKVNVPSLEISETDTLNGHTKISFSTNIALGSGSLPDVCLRMSRDIATATVENAAETLNLSLGPVNYAFHNHNSVQCEKQLGDY